MTPFRETLDVDGWVWTPFGELGYMIDAVNRSTKDRYRVFARGEEVAREQTQLLRRRGFDGVVV